jgi:hypothetical protein
MLLDVFNKHITRNEGRSEIKQGTKSKININTRERQQIKYLSAVANGILETKRALPISNLILTRAKS